MPSQIPATFASAAASNGSSDGHSAIRGGGGGGGPEWPRSRPNGATQTFRRSSQAANSSGSRDIAALQHQMAGSASASASNLYVPPHMSASLQQSAARPAIAGEHRYSKEQLLEIYKGMGGRPGDWEPVLNEGWYPGASLNASNGSWSRRDDNKENAVGPDICWDSTGGVLPLALADMTEDEKLLFSSSVNSPLKPPPQSAGKDAAQTPSVNGRKSSISQTPGSASGSTPGARPGVRRRDTSDAGSSINSMASPTAFRSGREENHLVTPPPSLLRRRTDFKESSTGPSFGERAKLDTSLDSSSPFGSFKRTAPMSASVNGPSSPWATTGPQSAGFGSFGSFAIDSSAQPGTPGDKKLGFGSARGESRFRGLMNRESSEDIGKSKDKQNLSLLEKLGETEHDGEAGSQWMQGRRGLGQEGGNILDELDPRGSAALVGDEPDPHDSRRAHDDIGFSALGQSGEPSFRSVMVGRGDPGRGQEPPPGHIQVGGGFREPLSPSGTNPYQSPEADKPNDGNDTDDDHHSNPYSNRPSSKPFGMDAGDRSQTSSAGATRFGNLGGLGGLGGIGSVGGWSGAGPGSLGGPGRAVGGFGSPFQDPVFGDVASPGATGLFGGPPSAGYGAIGRGSKMGSLFPSAMQDQLREPHGFESFGQPRGVSMGLGMPPRDTSSPARQSHGVLDDLFGNAEAQLRSNAPGVSSPFSLGDASSASTQNLQQSMQASISAPAAGVAVSSPPTTSPQEASSNQMPTAQQKTMVMPDRMRWIYRDPQGNTQGPWSGLEMHDWYKAGFFSPELLVKKQEDTDYEPLAQLIRRIGNSREPFLVPQIGIPHGAPISQPGAPGAVLGTAPPAGAAQPPFPGNFPSFGTTLTADQQNALERRKQEEQYLMARQKEHLVHHHTWMRQFQGQGPPAPQGMMPQGLHHHSSAHSLQSQPSYGSITSPAGYQAPAGAMPMQQQQQSQPGIPGFFDRPGQQLGGFGSNTGAGRGSDLPSSLERLSMEGLRPSSLGSGMPPQGQDALHQQRVASMLQDRSRLQSEQEPALQGMSEQESQERFSQYQLLRAQEEEHAPSQAAHLDEFQTLAEDDSADIGEQYQPALASDKVAVSAPDPSQLDSAPAPSVSPLPAPAAQRKHPVIDTISSETRSRSQTPVETPTTATLAPWAKDTAESTKGPSLKEIQEAEARKAAQQEELAAASRRAALAEQERILAAQVQAQNMAGLPSGANWATASSPSAASGAPAWSKKAVVATPSAGPPKKTLSQIQKEEEARKNRAAAAAAAAAASASPPPSAASTGPAGKRYADLASKVASPTGGPAPGISGGAGGAWTTVGASGKTKTLAGATGPTRTVSESTTPSAAPAKLAGPIRGGAPSSKQTAQEELGRWAKAALAKGMNAGINLDDFVRGLLSFPADAELVSDSVYSNSQTLDGHRFADEFLRRRKLADKGQVAPEASGSFFAVGGALDGAKNGGGGGGGGSSGWSEVARKGEKASEKAAKDREDSGHAFKVVAAKKKGKR